ncbi:MAG: RagB/SusD family nutrient uptake outer membrane protein [Pedobacter sp.]|nr:MAG: RagB/SusD family nutrient uptake outer membrane protein [Pedobacter sp.]
MMKKIVSYIILVAGFTVLLSSCKKELELKPYSAIELGESFKTVNDAKAWDNGLSASLRSRVYGIYTYSQDVQADQLNATLEYGNRNGNPHRWGTSFLADDYTIRDTWSGYYFMMKNVNTAIAGYPLITAATPAEQAALDKYRGSAYAMRAYLYSELIIRFAKAYEPATATTDPGVPLVLTYNPNDRPGRATVKEVYDQIISDITAATPLLTATPGTQGATTFTLHALKALEARVRLNMQDWTGAKAAADAVIGSGTYPLYSTQAGLTSMWVNDANQETIMRSLFIAPAELGNANNIYLGFQPANNKFIPDYVPSQWVVDKYAATDIRKNVYFAQKPLLIQGVDYPNIWVVNKFPGNPALFTGANTNYMHSARIFRVAELYLISAEAGARAGGAAATDALVKLNELRTKRGLIGLVGLTGQPLMDEIKEERFKSLENEIGLFLDQILQKLNLTFHHSHQPLGAFRRVPVALR